MLLVNTDRFRLALLTWIGKLSIPSLATSVFARADLARATRLPVLFVWPAWCGGQYLLNVQFATVAMLSETRKDHRSCGLGDIYANDAKHICIYVNIYYIY